MFAEMRYAFFVIVGFSFLTVSAMEDQQVRESFMYTLAYDSAEEIKRFVEVYKTQIDHQTFCHALHKTLAQGNLPLIRFLIKEGAVDVMSETLGIAYETGNKPLTALEIVDLRLSQADAQEDRERYQKVKVYLQELICSDVRYADDEVVLAKPDHTCRNTSCLLFAGSLLCWYIYMLMMQIHSGTVMRN